MSLFQCLGSPRLVSQTHLHKKILSAIPEGTSQDENYIFHRDKEVVNCFSRICDHNRGRLTLNGQKAVCPLHGWIFDPKEGAYDNVQISKSKEEILVSLDKDLLTVEKIEGFLEYPNYKPKNTRIEVSFYSHACLLFSSNEFRFAIDPWIVGPAFVSGWWPSHTPVEGWKNDINSSDFIYIPFTYEELNQFGYDDDDFHIHNYGSLGFTKNITIKSTVYIGYSRILGIDRDIQVYPLNRWEEQDMVDIGYIYLTRKVSFITGLSFHLPYYNNETPSSANYTSFEKINIRPQLGVGFNL